MLRVVYGPDPHTHVQLGSFLFSSPLGRWIAAVYNRPPPPSPHMRSYVEDSHLLSPFHPRLLIILVFFNLWFLLQTPFKCEISVQNSALSSHLSFQLSYPRAPNVALYWFLSICQQQTWDRNRTVQGNMCYIIQNVWCGQYRRPLWLQVDKELSGEEYLRKEINFELERKKEGDGTFVRWKWMSNDMGSGNGGGLFTVGAGVKGWWWKQCLGLLLPSWG